MIKRNRFPTKLFHNLKTSNIPRSMFLCYTNSLTDGFFEAHSSCEMIDEISLGGRKSKINHFLIRHDDFSNTFMKKKPKLNRGHFL